MWFLSSSETSPAQRWGLVYLFLAILFEVRVRQVNDITLITFDGLAILAATFLGPGIVHLLQHFLKGEWDGIWLAGITLAICTVVTLLIAGMFRLAV